MMSKTIRIPNFSPPNLDSGAATLVQSFALRLAFHGTRVPEAPREQRYLTAYIILTDKAAREYMAACDAMRSYADNGKIRAFFEGIGHFENCINAATRAMLVFTQLAAGRNNPWADKEVRRAILAKADKFRPLRNAIEHLDGDIRKGIEEGKAHLLCLNDEGTHLWIGDNSMPVIDLHETVQILHETGKAMFNAMIAPDANWVTVRPDASPAA